MVPISGGNNQELINSGKIGIHIGYTLRADPLTYPRIGR